MKLNLGCGFQVVDSWVNVDYFLGARLAKVPHFRSINRRMRFFNHDWDGRIFNHDLTKHFPWHDSSTDMIYTSHSLSTSRAVRGAAFSQNATGYSSRAR